MDRPSNKQIGMLSYMMRSNFPKVLREKIDERGRDTKLMDLEQFAMNNLDKYQLSSFLNIICDEDLQEDFREIFIREYLLAKGYEV